MRYYYILTTPFNVVEYSPAELLFRLSNLPLSLRCSAGVGSHVNGVQQCDSTDSLTDESKYLDNVFSKNNYNPDFVKRNVYKNNEPNTTNAKPVTTATIPYIKGTSETIARILQPYNIRVAHKPITTLRQLLTNQRQRRT